MHVVFLKYIFKDGGFQYENDEIPNRSVNIKLSDSFNNEIVKKVVVEFNKTNAKHTVLLQKLLELNYDLLLINNAKKLITKEEFVKLMHDFPLGNFISSSM